MIEKRINGGNYQPVMTDKLVLDSTPTVNSLNGVTSDAVARAVAGASGEVPQVTENDNGKVLTAVYDASGPAVEWGDAPSGLPDDTGASQGDVLTIGSSGPEWATPSAGGGSSGTGTEITVNWTYSGDTATGNLTNAITGIPKNSFVSLRLQWVFLGHMTSTPSSMFFVLVTCGYQSVIVPVMYDLVEDPSAKGTSHQIYLSFVTSDNTTPINTIKVKLLDNDLSFASGSDMRTGNLFIEQAS